MSSRKDYFAALVCMAAALAIFFVAWRFAP